VTGAVFVEYVFNWPDWRACARMPSRTDYPLLMGTAMLVTAAVLLGGVITDLVQHALDPAHEAG
jgi:ABC-type dipeptide/oligopeptide/nickel transport system permease component